MSSQSVFDSNIPYALSLVFLCVCVLFPFSDTGRTFFLSTHNAFIDVDNNRTGVIIRIVDNEWLSSVLLVLLYKNIARAFEVVLYCT